MTHDQPPANGTTEQAPGRSSTETDTRLRRELAISAHLRTALAKAQSELRSYENSTSWKITAPLRWLSRLVGHKPGTRAAVDSTPAYPASADTLSGLILPPAAEPRIVRQQGNLPPTSEGWLAVAVHAYHMDLLPDLLASLTKAGCPLRLYVTAPADKVAAAHAALVAQPLPFTLFETYNRGRDIAPFLVALRAALDDGASLILKLHTKLSPQLSNGQAWREEILEDLTAPGTPARILQAFQADSSLGIVSPAGHILSLTDHMGGNVRSVRRLADRLGIGEAALKAAAFVAGSMFYARASVLVPLRDIGLSASDFEPEAGQLDATMAHAVERLSGALAQSVGLRLAETSDLNAAPLVLGAGAYRFV